MGDLSPFINLLSSEQVWILVELLPELARQLVTDVVAGDSVASSHRQGEGHQHQGQDGVALQDGLVHCQQLLRFGEVAWARKLKIIIFDHKQFRTPCKVDK